MSDDPAKVKEVANIIEAGETLIADWVKANGGEMISYGGDEARFYFKDIETKKLEELRAAYAKKTGFTLSVGVGTTLRHGETALIGAKLTGKDKIVEYSEEVEAQVKKLSEENKETEAEKETKAYFKSEDGLSNLKISVSKHPDHKKAMRVLNTLEDRELDKQHIAVKTLKYAGLHHYSGIVGSMSPNEYHDYVVNHVAEADLEKTSSVDTFDRTALQDDEAKLIARSEGLNAGQEAFKAWVIQMGGTILTANGTEMMAKLPSTALNFIQNLQEDYVTRANVTATIGIGKKISESTRAKTLGKLRGKGEVVTYDDSTNQEIEMRLKDKDTTDSAKMQVALREPNQNTEALKEGQDPYAQGQEAPEQDSAQPQQEAPEQEQQQEEAPQEQEAPQEDQDEFPTDERQMRIDRSRDQVSEVYKAADKYARENNMDPKYVRRIMLEMTKRG
jgi:hypothetical protein